MGTKGQVICTALGVGFLDVITTLDGRELVASIFQIKSTLNLWLGYHLGCKIFLVIFYQLSFLSTATPHSSIIIECTIRRDAEPCRFIYYINLSLPPCQLSVASSSSVRRLIRQSHFCNEPQISRESRNGN